MTLPEDFLYQLLPAFIRNRDFYQGQPLRALMEVLDFEYRQLWAAAAEQYEDWFIETCRPDKIAAIGELLAISPDGIQPAGGGGRLRPLVANTIAYRRRKGVPAALEGALRDATGWTVRVQTMAQKLVAAQALDEPRPGAWGTVDLRDELALSTLGTPFERLPRIDSVRRLSVDPKAGLAPPDGVGFNLTDLGISIWRLSSYPLSRVEACWQAPGCYFFHPLGVDTPLFNRPRLPLHPTDPVEPTQVPEPLSALGMAREIAALRLGEVGTGLFGEEPVLEIFDPESGQPIAATAIAVADLSAWRRPDAATGRGRAQSRAPGSEAPGPPRVAVDPVLGRLAFPEGIADSGPVSVSFHYGFAADMGGGPYLTSSRPQQRAGGFDPESAVDLWQSEVVPAVALPQALADWAASGRRQGWIRLSAGGRDGLSNGASGAGRANGTARALAVDLRGGRELAIEITGGAPAVVLSDLVALADESASAAKLWLSGLWLGARLETRGSLELVLSHCTLCPPGVPGPSRAAPAGGARKGPTLILSGPSRRRLHIHRSILGPIYHRDGQTHLVARDTILDGGSSVAVGAGPTAGGSRLVLDLARVTALGSIRCAELRQADSVIFAGSLQVSDVAQGSVRYSCVPVGSRTPPRSRCVAAGTVPVFTSRRYGSPGYAQLSDRCPRSIRCGSEKGAEIGAFEQLYQAQREAAALTVLAESMPVGLSPRIVYVT